MSKYERTARIEGVDAESGTFPMTLASEAEASDGHILSIKGGDIPERMPLLVSHWNEPSSQAGSVLHPQKALKESPPKLRAVGQIELTGEGASAEIRRDLFHMISKGHVSAVSVRWNDDPDYPPVPRVNLPSDHPYFVDASKAKGPKRWGLFFEHWKALEGSIVAVGADPQALIGRAEETEGEVATFWRAMAEDAAPLEEHAAQEPAEEIPEKPSEEARIAAALACVRVELTKAVEAGASSEDITEIFREAAGFELAPAPESESIEETLEEREDLLERLEAVEEQLRALAQSTATIEEPEREETPADPLPAIASPKELFAEIRKQLKEAIAQNREYVREEVSKARGKVQP